MALEENDWRLMGQEGYLQGATLAWKPYRARSATWEHDHCEFCGVKFMDPNFSEAHRRFIGEHADVLTEGYTTTADHARGAECHWVCKPCFDDFADLFQWRVVAAD